MYFGSATYCNTTGHQALLDKLAYNGIPAEYDIADGGPSSNCPVITNQPLVNIDSASTPDSISQSNVLIGGELAVSGGACANINAVETKLLGTNDLTMPDGVGLLGGVQFELLCTELGGQAAVTVKFNDNNYDINQLRAYKLISGELKAAQVVFTKQDNKVHATFTIKDGDTTNLDNLIDEDGRVNATIVDPIYFGLKQTVGVPKSGYSQTMTPLAAILAVMLGLIAMRLTKTQSNY